MLTMKHPLVPARQMSIEYFYGVGGAWEILDSDTALSGGETVTYDEHYSVRSTVITISGLKLQDLVMVYSAFTHDGIRPTSATVQGIPTTMVDGGAIGDFVQDGPKC